MHPKIAITSLNHWAIKNGFKACRFYDIDMLYPSDEDIEKYILTTGKTFIGQIKHVFCSKIEQYINMEKYQDCFNILKVVKKIIF